MTLLEERFMNAIPSHLRDIRDSLDTIRRCQQMPIIEFREKDPFGQSRVITEQFKSASYDGMFYHINGFRVAEEEYNRIIALLHKHPLFAE